MSVIKNILFKPRKKNGYIVRLLVPKISQSLIPRAYEFLSLSIDEALS